MKRSVAVDLGWYRMLDGYSFWGKWNEVFSSVGSEEARERIRFSVIKGDPVMQPLIDYLRFLESLVVAPDPVVDGRALGLEEGDFWKEQVRASLCGCGASKRR